MSDKAYWEKIWNNTQGNDFYKARELLLQYSGTSSWTFSNFFSMSKYTKTYANQVSQALYHFLNPSSHIGLETDPNVKNLLTLVKQNVGDIKTDGDLKLIMEVIKDKTTVDYSTVPSSLKPFLNTGHP